jgi:hypothetical protein
MQYPEPRHQQQQNGEQYIAPRLLAADAGYELVLASETLAFDGLVNRVLLAVGV